MSDLTPELDRLGAALERAAARDLAAEPAPAPRRSRRRPTGRLIAIAVAALALAGGVAFAATRALVDEGTVAASIPAGTFSLIGTEPTCTVVTEGVEYHCTLAKAPAPEVEDWTGTVEPTVDATQHVNGGCRSLRADGMEWSCYLGREAVRQKIIGAGFLGQPSSGPGRG
jgi:hypothetical protein